MEKNTELFMDFLKNNEIPIFPEVGGIKIGTSERIYDSARDIYSNEPVIQNLLKNESDKYKPLVESKLRDVNLHVVAAKKFMDDMNVSFYDEDMIIDEDSLTLKIELGDYTKNYLFSRLDKNALELLDMPAVANAITNAELIISCRILSDNSPFVETAFNVETAGCLQTSISKKDGFVPPFGLKAACYNVVRDFIGEDPFEYVRHYNESEKEGEQRE